MAELQRVLVTVPVMAMLSLNVPVYDGEPEYAAARREGRERARAVVEQRLRAETIDN